MSFGNGIPLASGFDYGAKSPLDSRICVKTIAGRDEHVTANRAYEGMLVINCTSALVFLKASNNASVFLFPEILYVRILMIFAVGKSSITSL